MEGRGREAVQLSSTNPAKPTGILALRNFTIPRKKRVSGQVLLEPCPEESRDYSLIQSKLREARLDMSKEHANAWLWKDVKLVHNEEFLKEFSEKRSEMRTKGRHGREMEERFCFLVASHETTTQIYQLGLRTETQEQYSLGKPSLGVYVFRHVDVALKQAANTSLSGKNLIVFKVLFGKVKKVTPSLDWNRTPDPTVAFDCHMSKDAVSHRESLSQQVLGSSVFLFDYNDIQELNNRPRQCLPYAVVSFVPAFNATPPTSISPPVSPVKLPTSLTHGPLERLRGCTVAKRRGKGENATVTFKHFATQGLDYASQLHGADPPIQQELQTMNCSELQNPLLFFPPQPYMPLFHSAGYFSPSLPLVDSFPFQNSVPFQNYPEESTFTSTPSVYGSNTEKCALTPQTSTEKISTIVYSSRLVKDPRLSRQETNTEKKSSEQEKEISLSEADEQPHPQNKAREDDLTRTASCEKQSLTVAEEQSKDCCLKSENMPSIKLFKMKFQKYAVYLNMSEEERHKTIWAQEGPTPEQKQALLDRIHFYEMYYHKSKQGLLFQKDSETQHAFESFTKMKPKNNKPTTSLSTLNEAPSATQDSTVSISISSEGSNMASTTGLLHTESPNVDMSNADNEVRHNGIESTVKNNEQNPGSPDLETVVQSEEPSLEQSPLLWNTSEKGEAIESKDDLEQPLSTSCPSVEVKVNPQAVSESKRSTSSNESTLSTNVEENPEFHSITAMDVAHCVDIAVSDCNLPCAAGTGPDQNSQRSTNNGERPPLTHSESDDGSEMSIEVKGGELRQDNTIHRALYQRLQLSQLLPNLNGANTYSNKSYLLPKDLDRIPCISQLCDHLNETVPKEDSNKAETQRECAEGLQHIVTSKSNQVSATTESLTLSERFSKLRSLQKKLTVFVHESTISNTVCSTGDVESNAEGLHPSSDGEKGTGSNNVKLIQLLAQRFNAARTLANCRRLRGKYSNVLSRRKTNSRVRTLKHSYQSPAHALKRALHLRKRCLRKAKRDRKTKLVSQCHDLSSKSTLNPSTCPQQTSEISDDNKDHGSSSNSNAASQSSGPQGHNQLESNQEDNITSSSPNTCFGEKSGHDDEFMPISQSKEQTTEVSERISSNSDITNPQGDVPLDTKDQVMTVKVEPERGTNSSSICPQEESFPITCSAEHESNSDVEIATAKPIEEATSQKNLSQASVEEVGKDKCDTGEVSTHYNTGADEDKSNPVQAVSSIPSDITSGNTIVSCTAKAQTAMTPDLPRLMNNDETKTETEKGTLYDSAVDSARSGVIKSVADIRTNVSSAGKTEAMEASSNIQNCLANSTDAKDESFTRAETSAVERSSLQTADFISYHLEKTNHPSGPASRPNLLVEEHTKSSSRVANSHVETTSDLHNRVIRDAKGTGLVAMRGDLHPAWQGQDKNSLPSTSTETQLISKLRDYLTKFECTVKKQDPVNANDSVKNSQVPMAWITLDSTLHKQQLFDTRHYSRLDYANLRLPGSDLYSSKKDRITDYMLSSTNKEVTGRATFQDEIANSSLTPAKRKTSKPCSQPKSYTSKRIRSKLTRVSPDSTSMLETVQKDSQSHLAVNKDTGQSQISTSIPNMQQWIQNLGNTVQQSQVVHSQSSEILDRSGPAQVNQAAEKAAKGNEQTLYDKKVHTYVQEGYNVTDISSTLKLADHAVSVAELSSLQLKCKSMLQHFISKYERDQKLPFSQSCISRNIIMEKYLDHPPAPVELKFEGLNSFLELQMMVEAFQFVENKMNFLSRKATFRSLLWYDPSLYGELYKGAVGFQQQSSLFSSFQQCLAIEGYSKLQEYYAAVSTLHQQLQDAPDTSYYMYLKSKRERLEIEAALRNPPDIKSFFLSVPVALMVNFGDSLESLEKAHSIVMTFVETPSDRLPGTFDVGKAEHLSIICRYLQEKVIFLKSHEQISKLSWFGLEHLLYDASKLLVWRESEHGMSNEVLLQYKRSNPQIVYGVTEAGVALVNKIEPSAPPADTARITAQQQMDGVRNYRSIQPGISTDRTQSALDPQSENGIKDTYQPARRRTTHPPLRCNLNNGGVNPLVIPNLPTQLRKPTPLPAFPQQSGAVHWRTAGNTWDWKPPAVGQPSKSHPEIRALLLSKRRATVPCAEPRTDIQSSHAVIQQQWPSPFILNPPRTVERMSHQPAIGASHHTELRKEQASDATVPLMPFPFPTSSLVPPPVSLLPFSNTSNPVPPHEISAPLNYPFFLFNGRTYSAAAPSVPLPGSTLPTEARYHPHPV